MNIKPTMSTSAVRDTEKLPEEDSSPYAAVDPIRRRLCGAMAIASLSGGLSACGGGGTSPPTATRTWKMGFSANPPRPDTAVLLHGVDLWSTRAELAIIHEELPWTDLVKSMPADAILDRDKVQLVQYFRNKGLQLVFMGDLNDGLSRGEEAPQLRALGKSISDPAVQQLYRSYMLAVARKLQPDYIGLAAETNLIRLAAPAALYGGVKAAANAAAADLRTAGVTAPLMVSVQVETAWGVLAGPGPYVGIEADFADFPFMQMLGLSSYPYFSFAQPEDIPADYYSRLLQGRAVSAMVTEGGWTSASVGTVKSSPDIQARYIDRHAQLLDSIRAKGVLQLLFADLDLTTFPTPYPTNLPLFISIGLTDSDFRGKPSLARWDAYFSRRLSP
jgi:hypothetical protein